MHILTDYKSDIKGMISYFDRIIIKGYNRQLCNSKQFGYFLSAQDILYIDYPEYAQEKTDLLCKHIEKIAAELDRPSIYLRSPKNSKEETALNLLKESPVDSGLVCLISTVENCSAMGLEKNHKTGQLYVGSQNRKYKFYYLYIIDDEFGWMDALQNPNMVSIYDSNIHQWQRISFQETG